MRRHASRTAWALGLCAVALLGAACRGGDSSAPTPAGTGPAGAPAEPLGPPDPAVAATVERVLDAAEHPWLRWPEIPDVAPVLKELHEAEADRLFWFAGDTPYPMLEESLAALTAAAQHGLDPADYDGDQLRERWAAVAAGSASAAERALFDLGLSVGVARLISAGHVGRVDPATLHWGYDVAPKRLDLATTLRNTRSGKGLGPTLAELEPQLPHYKTSTGSTRCSTPRSAMAIRIRERTEARPDARMGGFVLAIPGLARPASEAPAHARAAYPRLGLSPAAAKRHEGEPRKEY